MTKPVTPTALDVIERLTLRATARHLGMRWHAGNTLDTPINSRIGADDIDQLEISMAIEDMLDMEFPDSVHEQPTPRAMAAAIHALLSAIAVDEAMKAQHI